MLPMERVTPCFWRIAEKAASMSTRSCFRFCGSKALIICSLQLQYRQINVQTAIRKCLLELYFCGDLVQILAEVRAVGVEAASRRHLLALFTPRLRFGFLRLFRFVRLAALNHRLLDADQRLALTVVVLVRL